MGRPVQRRMDMHKWVMLSAAVLLLRGGLAMYLCGQSRSKNALSTLFRAVAETCVALLAFWAIGGAILGHSWHRLFDIDGRFDLPMLFCAAVSVITAAIAVAPTLERSRSIVWLAGTILMAAMITPLAWRLAWSHWLIHRGFVDVAGSSFVFWSAGLCGLIAAIALGPRSGKYNRDGSTNILPGHSGPLASLGIFLILALWTPLIAGCILLRGQSVSDSAAVNPVLAGAAAAITAMLYCQFRYRKLDVSLVHAGLLGGLVCINGAADQLTSPWAVLAGAVAGVLVPWLAVSLDLYWKIDDPSGLMAVSLLGGLLGTLAAALAPCQRLHRLGAQLLGLTLIGLLCVVLCSVFFLLLRMMSRLRCSEAEEYDGLDLAQHDLNAYPDFQQTMIKSYDLREM